MFLKDKKYFSVCYALLMCLGSMASMNTAQALQLSAAQLQMVQQLPASEKAKLAENAGVQLPRSKSLSYSMADVYTSLPTPILNANVDSSSALEKSFTARLTSTTDQATTDQATTDQATTDQATTATRSLSPNLKDKQLRMSLVNAVSLGERNVHQILKQFGYHLFAGKPKAFAPLSDIPMPPEYILGPGDELYIQYYGSRNDSLSLIVNREGVIELPDVGTLSLAGLSFIQVKAILSKKINERLMNVTASISMGRLRSIRVFVLGDAQNPGSYLVSGVSTMSNALFLAGGISNKGSLRHVILKRQGKRISELDLYDFLLRGDSAKDVRLQTGDVIFIPPIGRVVAVAGEVVRPAIYELKNEHYVDDLVRLAGGLSPVADQKHAQIDRVQSKQGRVRLDVALNNKHHKIKLHDGDLLSVYTLPEQYSQGITLLGQVKRPGNYGLKKGMRLSAILQSRGDLLKDAYLTYALVQRVNAKDRSLLVVRVSLEKLWGNHGDSSDIVLQDGDKIFILAKSAIEPISSVHVSGEVVHEGSFPLTEGMRLVDLVLTAGGPTERAYLKSAEITRYEVVDGEKRESSHIQVDLGAALKGDPKENMALQAYDVLTIRQLSNWRNIEHVTLKGEVRFPGAYPIEDGEHLSSLLKRAGGYTGAAYLRAGVFTRETIRKEQQKKIDVMAKKLETEIARLEGQASTDPKALAAVASAKSMLDQMKKTKATGRLVIELKNLKKLKGSDFDVTLHDGDTLYIPKRPDELLVMGQVYNNTAMLYQKKLSLNDYISRAGGVTRTADEGRIYVVHASGLVEPVKGGWHKTKLYPGDAIVVPEDLEQFNFLGSLMDWSKVLYQFGTALASMRVVGLI